MNKLKPNIISKRLRKLSFDDTFDKLSTLTKSTAEHWNAAANWVTDVTEKVVRSAATNNNSSSSMVDRMAKILTTVSPGQDLTASVQGQEVDVALVGQKIINASEEFELQAHVFSVDNNETVTAEISYVLCLRDHTQKPIRTVVIDSTSANVVKFRLTAPPAAGTYSASLLVIQKKSSSKPLAIDRADFDLNITNTSTKRVSKETWWESAFNVLQQHHQKSKFWSKLTASLCKTMTFEEAAKTQVLATLLVTLQQQQDNDAQKMLAVAALASLASLPEAQELLRNHVAIVSNVLCETSAFDSSAAVRAEALRVLQMLAYGDALYNAMIRDVLQRQLAQIAVCMIASISASITSNSASSSVAITSVSKQIGTSYRSNNAGDGPEKTRDHKYWFPRFKSHWLGCYRSKEMFPCCECAVVPSSTTARYKAANLTHCICGKDAWQAAKAVEEVEYKRRSMICKQFGGIKYSEAMLHMTPKRKAMMPEAASWYSPKRLRTDSVGSSCSSSTTSTSSSSFQPTLHHRPLVRSPSSVSEEIFTTFLPNLEPLTASSPACGVELTAIDFEELASVLSDNEEEKQNGTTSTNFDLLMPPVDLEFDELVGFLFADE